MSSFANLASYGRRGATKRYNGWQCEEGGPGREMSCRGPAPYDAACSSESCRPPMPQFAANLSMLFTEWPFLDRFERAAQAGFRFVEFQFPYEVPAAEIRARLDRHQLQAVLHNMPAGNREAGERGIGGHPDRGEEFRAGIAQAIAYATALGVPRFNVLAGRVPPGVDEQGLRRTFVANLRQAA